MTDTSEVKAADVTNEYVEACVKALKLHMAYELIPNSGKVVVFDSELSVLQSFQGLLEHDINCAPVFDSSQRRYLGMLSVTDFIDILRHSYGCKDGQFHPVNQRIKDWQDIKRSRGTSVNRLLCISPECSLYEAVRLLIEYRIHRLCVVQLALGNTVLCVLSYHRILRFLQKEVQKLAEKLSIRTSGIGTYTGIVTATLNTCLEDALNLLITHHVPALPLLDDQGVVVDYYSRSDTRFLAVDGRLEGRATLSEALGDHQHERPPISNVKCSLDDSLFRVCRKLIGCRRHMVIVTDTQGQLAATLSLEQIFVFILKHHKSTGRHASDTAQATSSQPAPEPHTPRTAPPPASTTAPASTTSTTTTAATKLAVPPSSTHPEPPADAKPTTPDVPNAHAEAQIEATADLLAQLSLNPNGASSDKPSNGAPASSEAATIHLPPDAQASK